jgi:hypothetical protein
MGHKNRTFSWRELNLSSHERASEEDGMGIALTPQRSIKITLCSRYMQVNESYESNFCAEIFFFT